MNFDLNKFPLWTALVTPFTSDLKLHKHNYRTLLRRQEAAQNGVVVLGSTGEALLLNSEEKKEILTLAVEQNLNVPIMVGVSGINLEESLEWLEFCETLPVHAYLMVTPLYTKPG